jgi:hypothetical protein
MLPFFVEVGGRKFLLNFATILPICTVSLPRKFSLQQAMKAQMGSRGIALLFL